MSTRQPSGIPIGGQFAANAHDEAHGALDAPRTVYTPVEDVKVGDIVWDGETGFVVSEITKGYPYFASADEIKRGAQTVLHSARGDYWMISHNQATVTVLRDHDVLHDMSDEINGDY